MHLIAIVDVNTTASVNEPTSMVSVLIARPTITKLEHRSIELTDHTHSTIARARAPNARASSRVLCNRMTSNPAPSRSRRVSSGVDRKLVLALLAQGVG